MTYNVFYECFWYQQKPFEHPKIFSFNIALFAWQRQKWVYSQINIFVQRSIWLLFFEKVLFPIKRPFEVSFNMFQKKAYLLMEVPNNEYFFKNTFMCHLPLYKALLFKSTFWKDCSQTYLLMWKLKLGFIELGRKLRFNFF